MMKNNMKRFLFISSIVGLTSAAFAQSYSIGWQSIDAGSGTSTGGAYSVTGSIGQHDAGQTMTGGKYSVTGGFWSLAGTVQTPQAPLLRIYVTATNTAVLYWPSSSAGFTLEQTQNLASTNWTAVPEPVSDDGANKAVVVAPVKGPRFYRLSK